MPKSFTFYGGEPSSGVSAALQGRTAATQQGTAMKAQSVSDLSTQLVRGLELAQERKHREALAKQAQDFETQQLSTQLQHAERAQQAQQTFQAQQAQLDRSFRAREFEANLAEGRVQAQQDLMRSLGTAGIQAGLPPGPMIDRVLNMSGENFQSNPPQIPGVPGGFMQEGKQPTDPMYLALRGQGGGGGGFSDMQVPPAEPSEGDKKRKDDDQVARAKREIEQFILSPDGQDAMLAQKVTRLQAHGWENLPPKELEAAVLKEYPMYAPIKQALGEGDGEDRSALDGLMKWLKEPQEVQVVTGASVAMIRNGLWGRYEPRVVDQAITERFGKETATTQAEVKQVARAKLLAEMQEQKQAGSRANVSVQAGSFQELAMGQREQDETAKLGSGQGGPMELNRQSLEGVGLNFDQLGRNMQSAANFPGYQVALDPSGRAVIQSTSGVQVPQAMQAEADALWNDPSRAEPYQNIRAALELDPATKKSGSELNKAGAKREMKTKGAAPAKKPTGTPTKPTAPKAEAAPYQTPATSALGALRDRLMQAKRAKLPTGGKSVKVPPDMATIGLDSATLNSLLFPRASPLFSGGARK